MGTYKKSRGNVMRWVIVLCGHYNHICTVGLMIALSVLYVSWLDQFGDGKGATSWIISIGVACMFGLCPIPASLASRFGFRAVGFVGGLLSAAGLVMSVFATSISYLVVSIGLVTGTGLCFSYIPAVTIVALHFKRRRSLAIGLTMMGTGIGAFVLSPLLNYLEEIYTWRGALLIQAGICLNMCVTAMFFDVTPVGEDEDDDLTDEEANDEEIDDEEEEERKRFLEISRTATTNGDGRGNQSSINNSHDILPLTAKSDYCDAGDHCQVKVIEEKATSRNNLGYDLFQSSHNQQKHLNRMYTSVGDIRTKHLHGAKNQLHLSLQSLRLLTRGMSKHDSLIKCIQKIDMASLASMPMLFLVKKNSYTSLKESPTVIADTDVKSQRTNDILESKHKDKSCISGCCSSPFVNEYLDLLKDKTFLAFAISNFFANLSFITPMVYMVDRIVHEGIDISIGAILVSACGIGNILGRFIFALFGDGIFSNRISFYISTLSMCGVGTILSILCGDNIILHGIYAAFFGCLIGVYTVLTPLVTVDIVGVSRFVTGYGIVLAFEGVATIIGPPLAGWLFDWTQSYTMSYIIMGVFLLISGLMMLPWVCVIISRQKKMERQQQEQQQLHHEEKQSISEISC